jgi:nucleotide-binding universal stress UspA family protein
MSTPFTSIVVPLDLEGRSPLAVAVAANLSEIGDLPVRLVTVASPGLSETEDQYSLAQLTERRQIRQIETVVLHSNEPAEAIAAFVADEERPLVVLTSAARTAVAEMFDPSVASQLVSMMTAPVLMIGPHVHESWRPDGARLAVCVGPSSDGSEAAGDVGAWLATFHAAPPVAVSVTEPEDDPTVFPDFRDSAQVERFTRDVSAAVGVTCTWDVLHGEGRVEALLDYVDHNPDVVFVSSSRNWTNPTPMRPRTMARRLVRRSPVPVLLLAHGDAVAEQPRSMARSAR